jgi:hypothetical protein
VSAPRGGRGPDRLATRSRTAARVPRRLLTCLLGAAWIVGSTPGCSSAPPIPERVAQHAEPEACESPASRALLAGFDPQRPGAGLRSGDAALFGLSLQDDGAALRWLVRITSLEHEAYADDGISLRVELFDERARPTASEVVLVSSHLLHGARVRPVATAAASKPGEGGFGASADALADILWRAIRRPSLLSLFGGIRVSAGVAVADGRTTVDAITGQPAFEFPVRIQVNRSPALLCTVTAVEPAPPLRVCGGFTRLVGTDPEDATRRVVLQLLAARCGR